LAKELEPFRGRNNHQPIRRMASRESEISGRPSRYLSVPSGGCEKIGFPLMSDLQSKKLRARMPSERLLRLGYTFRIKTKP
jgi:hypothetical protein